MALPVPTEAAEQIAFVQYLRLKGIPHWRTPNETYTKSWSQKRKNTDLGVSSGVPDLFCIVNNKLVAVEMKRLKGSTTSENQKKWIRLLSDAGVPTRVCRGAGEAIEFIDDQIKKEQYE